MSVNLSEDPATRSSHIKLRLGPDGIHIFDRYTGLNVLLDEVQVPRDSYSRAPRHVSIALTNVCDLACQHCYAPKTSHALTLDWVMQLALELDANGCLSIGFGGGEPTLHPSLKDLCQDISQQTRLGITMTTHAHHLSDDVLDSLHGSIHFLRVSMDGVANTYESIRNRSFSSLIERITSIRKRFAFGINYLVNEQTIPDLDPAFELAKSLGASEFLLLPEQPTLNRHGIDSYTLEALGRWIVRNPSDSISLSISEGSLTDIPTCDPLPKATGLQAYAHIDASGCLKRSSYEQVGIQIGDHSFLEALDVLSLTKAEAIP